MNDAQGSQGWRISLRSGGGREDTVSKKEINFAKFRDIIVLKPRVKF